jgi:hypothetical protein
MLRRLLLRPLDSIIDFSQTGFNRSFACGIGRSLDLPIAEVDIPRLIRAINGAGDAVLQGSLRGSHLRKQGMNAPRNHCT